MGQWDLSCLESPGVQIQSPAQHSRLRIQHCCSCDLGSDLIPGSGTPYAMGWPKKKKKKKDKFAMKEAAKRCASGPSVTRSLGDLRQALCLSELVSSREWG